MNGGNYWNLYDYPGYWYGNPGWRQNKGPRQKGKGGLPKGESLNQGGKALRTDHGCKVYRGSYWDLTKTERFLVGNMHVLSDFSCYGEWVAFARNTFLFLRKEELARAQFNLLKL